MLGQLPKTIEINGHTYTIRTDYRVILRIIAALNDEILRPEEKAFVCLVNIYEDFQSIPKNDIAEAYEKAFDFIDFGIKEDKKTERKMLDWEHDEQLIFPAINAVAGTEIRAAEYVHWWTFMGYFQSIRTETTFSTVMQIRQKKSRGEKLEKWEQNFYDNNRNLCDLKPSARTAATAENQLQEIYNSLLKKG